MNFVESENLFFFVTILPGSWCNRFLRLWPFPAHLPLRYTSAFDERGEAANPIWESKILQFCFWNFPCQYFSYKQSVFLSCIVCCSAMYLINLLAFLCHDTAIHQHGFCFAPSGWGSGGVGARDRPWSDVPCSHNVASPHVGTLMYTVPPQPCKSKQGNRCTVWCIEDSYGVTTMIWVIDRLIVSYRFSSLCIITLCAGARGWLSWPLAFDFRIFFLLYRYMVVLVECIFV